MRYREAKKLHNGDEIKVKETGVVETVSYIEDHGFTVYVFTVEGSDYHHTEIE